MTKRKVLFITEYLNPPYDEGIKKTAFNIYTELNHKYDLKVICRYGFKEENIFAINCNPLFLSRNIRKIISDFNPLVIIYLPFASSTFAGYLRLRVLRFFAQNAKMIFIALQPKPLKKWQKLSVNFLKPQYALTPSPSLQKFWESYNINSRLLPLITDLSVFKPLEMAEQKLDLRKKYNIPINAYLISHMGHINEGRNLESLILLQRSGYLVMIVGSSSTPKDALGPKDLKSKLEKEGIVVLDKFIELIEEIYQMSDLYIFPVLAPNSSIGMPLSILEARACGIPVLTTNFGSISAFMGDDNGGIIYSTPKRFSEAVKSIEKRDYTNSNVEDLNKKFYNILFEIIEN